MFAMMKRLVSLKDNRSHNSQNERGYIKGYLEKMIGHHQKMAEIEKSIATTGKLITDLSKDTRELKQRMGTNHPLYEKGHRPWEEVFHNHENG